MYIISELLDQYNLYDRIFNNKKQYTKKEKIKIFLDIIEGIKHIHSFGIVHCDLKLKNILFDKNGIAKITDFGIAKKLKSLKQETEEFEFKSEKTELIGETLRYLPYEYINNDEHCISPQFDIYSFGLMLYEAFSEKIAWGSLSKFDILFNVKQKNPFFLFNPKTTDIQLDSLIERCCDHDKAKRPNADEIKIELQKLE